MNVCPGFVYIGQSIRSCDRCGKPAWEHDFSENLAPGSGPFDPAWVHKPWSPEVIGAWQHQGRITKKRAQHLKQVKEDGMKNTVVSGHCCVCAEVCYHKAPVLCGMHQRRREHGEGKRMHLELPKPTHLTPQPTIVEWEGKDETSHTKVIRRGDVVEITGLQIRTTSSGTQYISLAVLRSFLPALLAACHWQENADD